jgi:lipoprotein-anchoring transpeptidase ErfK/SrfK
VKKNLIIILSVIGSAAAVLALCTAFDVFGNSEPQRAVQAVQAPPTATPPEPASPTLEPAAAAIAESTAIPTPAPLGIKKQALTFAELAPATTMSFEELVGDNGVYENASEIPPLPSSDTCKIVVNEYWQFAAVYAKDANGEYTVPVRYMIVTTGAKSSPTPKGTFKLGHRFVRFGLFEDFSVFGQYWRQIYGPYYFHSVLYTRRDGDAYNSSYSRLGRRGSHGCIRLTVPDARWIYYNAAPGSACEIITGNKNDEAAEEIKDQLIMPDKPGRRPRLSAGSAPVTEAWPGWQGNAYAVYQEYLASQGTQQ